MKKTLTVMTLLAGATAAYSQGVVSMQNYSGGFLGLQVFNIQPTGGTAVTVGGVTGFETFGNTANTYNRSTGATVYTGSPLGAGYDVALLGASGTIAQGNYSALSQASGSLVTSLVSPTSATPNAGGSWISTGVASIPSASGTTFTIAIAAWANTGTQGAATTLAAAEADGYAWGVSQMVTTTLATGNNPPGTLPYGAGNLVDFSLARTVPEPSTIALGVIGASTLLFRRRK